MIIRARSGSYVVCLRQGQLRGGTNFYYRIKRDRVPAPPSLVIHLCPANVDPLAFTAHPRYPVWRGSDCDGCATLVFRRSHPGTIRDFRCCARCHNSRADPKKDDGVTITAYRNNGFLSVFLSSRNTQAHQRHRHHHNGTVRNTILSNSKVVNQEFGL